MHQRHLPHTVQSHSGDQIINTGMNLHNTCIQHVSENLIYISLRQTISKAQTSNSIHYYYYQYDHHHHPKEAHSQVSQRSPKCQSAHIGFQLIFFSHSTTLSIKFKNGYRKRKGPYKTRKCKRSLTTSN